MAPCTCRCHGSLAQLLRAAAVAEEVTLRDITVPSTFGLLAALGPAAGALRALDFTAVGQAEMAEEVSAFGVEQQPQDS